MDRSRGKKCAESQWQKDAKKGANKHDNHPSILSRWQNDEMYRTSKLAHWCTENYCRYLDYQTTIDISDYAPNHERHRHENTITMKCNDSNPQSGSMRIRIDYQASTKSLGKPSRRASKNKYLLPEEFQSQTAKHNGQKPPRKVGMVEPKIGAHTHHNHFRLLFHHIRRAGGHSLGRRSMERSPMARSLLERS